MRCVKSCFYELYWLLTPFCWSEWIPTLTGQSIFSLFSFGLVQPSNKAGDIDRRNHVTIRDAQQVSVCEDPKASANQTFYEKPFHHGNFRGPPPQKTNPLPGTRPPYQRDHWQNNDASKNNNRNQNPLPSLKWTARTWKKRWLEDEVSSLGSGLNFLFLFAVRFKETVMPEILGFDF